LFLLFIASKHKGFVNAKRPVSPIKNPGLSIEGRMVPIKKPGAFDRRPRAYNFIVALD